MTSSTRVWRLGPQRTLALDRPRIMGILNCTPDSFSDGGTYGSVSTAVDAAVRMVRQGADVIDIGGESTRPGAQRVSADEQIRRVVPVIRGFRAVSDALVSVDTTLADVAEAALDEGANAINDVSAGLENERMFALTARRRAGIVLMHRLRPPDADVYSTKHPRPPEYEGGVVESVIRFLQSRALVALAAGVSRETIVLDPGLGFGKTVEQNLALIDGTDRIAALGYPVLSGLSRKSFTAALGGVSPEAPMTARVAPTLELSLRHLRAGASIFRVHDVAEHVRIFQAAS